ncbi:mannose-1-phosphate guanylyltransferase [Bacillus sp. ISL-47]|uniref:mannose-1-phosphate guanylyltransferase n=1 Tax=Bacillus sp. ISL-47 TaxID=2819130 RepID=UPI001BE86881|nr:sugar phosphate nucleotidyltransferase [Bacillus sp. ISL-47]MBT2686891.1 mannose-1-phosphate guanylyltransferase [Bacillus sp. ISL-47]MBT2710430.1 mannose-1-phosphate guanylyltransferase [Pseudomonas sp. ISL-84]
MKVVIMAGGKGSRFWPWSTEKKPKQFLSIYTNKSMLQETFERFRTWLPIEKIFVVTVEEYQNQVIEQLPQLPIEQIIVEPERKDTAACIALTALHFIEQGEDEVLAMCPADQYISDENKLRETLLKAEEVAQEENTIVTLGITPTRPDTGYGYIRTFKGNEEIEARKVKEFIEKPSLKDAERLLSCENVYWNSGIFIWKPSTVAHYMGRFQEDLWNMLNSHHNNLKFVYSILPKVSIDYAILEKASSIYTIPATFEWDDLGTWKSLDRIFKPDNNENITIGNVNVMKANKCTIISEEYDVVAIGVSDLIIVLTDEGLLVCHKAMEQEIKNALISWKEK